MQRDPPFFPRGSDDRLARFISSYLKFSYQARPERTKLTADGYSYLDTPLIMCDFEPAALKRWEEEIALASFDFRGQPEGAGKPTYRISVFDTDEQAKLRGWDKETKAEVESSLRSSPNMGRDFIELIRPRASAPWPNYDTIVASKGPKTVAAIIVDKVREDGYDPEKVVGYEEENLNRADVIAVLRQLQYTEDGEEIAA